MIFNRKNIDRFIEAEPCPLCDSALAAGIYDGAIELYSVAIDLDSATDSTLPHRCQTKLHCLCWKRQLLILSLVGHIHFGLHDRGASILRLTPLCKPLQGKVGKGVIGGLGRVRRRAKGIVSLTSALIKPILMIHVTKLNVLTSNFS